MLTETQRVQCPYCGEIIEIEIDPSILSQVYIEDCAVCCRPIEFTIEIGSDRVQIEAKRDDE